MSQRRNLRPGRSRPRPHPARGAGRSAPTRARLLALRVLERVERSRAYADLALRAALGRSELATADRALATELVYGTLRWRGRLDFILSHVLDRPAEQLEPAVVSALRLGAYQVIFTDRIPDRAAVDETVRCVRAAGLERAVGLVNAVLRRVAAEGASLPLPRLDSEPVDHVTHALSMPRWVAERWVARFGPDEAASLARACNTVPPRTVRTRRGRRERSQLLAELLPRFPEARACEYARDGIRLGGRGDPGRDPGFVEGLFTMQDEASQLVVDLLDPLPGERVLDACAAPGTKATASAERVGPRGSVVAVDRHPRRLDLVARDARRLGLDNLVTREADSAELPDDGATAGPFDRVLVDAPCSGLGALRRNPDLRWRVSPSDPARLASEVQRAILRRVARSLRPGGTLVYSTCTFEPEETDAVVAAFLAESPGFHRAPRAALPRHLQGTGGVIDEDGTLRCWPHRHDTDGFFAVRLERRS